MTYYWTCMDCGGLILRDGCNCNKIHTKGRETLRRIVEKRAEERLAAQQRAPKAHPAPEGE